MARYKLIDGKSIQFTEEEEKIRDAEEKKLNDDAPNRRMTELRRQRDVLLAETDWMGTQM